jgi:hypothetical protein
MGDEPSDLEAPVDAAARHDAYLHLRQLADWSPWAPFAIALVEAPRLPGVYLLRDPRDHVIRYVGMAGERAGSGRPQGLYGRLTVYRTGKGAVSGFGEAALDRALADPDWIASKLEHLRATGPQRAKEWARDAINRLAPEVSWATCADGPDARHLEVQVVLLLRPFGLWNR